MRSLAAFAVVGDHIRNLFWVDYPGVIEPNVWLSFLYFVTGSGRQAVIIFFVLSGFFVSATIRKHSTGSLAIESYVIDRLSRLYLVIVPALGLGALFDLLSRSLPGGALYFARPILHFGPAFETTFTLKTFLGNLFFLQGTFVDTFGSNGPLWSLANEFWYYAAWALICVAIIGSTRQRRIGAILLLAASMAFVSRAIWLRFPIWLMGAFVHAIPQVRNGILKSHGALIWIAALSLFAGSLAISKKGLIKDWDELLIGLSFTGVLFLVTKAESQVSSTYIVASKFFADFSFSLYAVHFPLLILVRTLFWRHPLQQPSASSFGFLLLLFVGILIVAKIFASVTEARTVAVRRLFRPALV